MHTTTSFFHFSKGELLAGFLKHTQLALLWTNQKQKKALFSFSLKNQTTHHTQRKWKEKREAVVVQDRIQDLYLKKLLTVVVEVS